MQNVLLCKKPSQLTAEILLEAAVTAQNAHSLDLHSTCVQDISGDGGKCGLNHAYASLRYAEKWVTPLGSVSLVRVRR